MPNPQSRLRYLSSDHVDGPVPCHYVDLWDRADHQIGALDGVIIDTATERLRYLVVDSVADSRRTTGHRRFLLPFSAVEVDLERRALRVDVDDRTLDECEAFDPLAYPAFA